MQADAEPGGKLHEMMSAFRKNARAGKFIQQTVTRDAGRIEGSGQKMPMEQEA